MDITIPNLKPGKHRVLLKYSDPFSTTDSSFSRALFIETPKAPPLISKSIYAPTISKQKVTKNIVTVYTDTITHRQRTSNTVTLFTSSNHGLKKGNKITVTGMNVADLNGTFSVNKVISAKALQYIKKGPNNAKAADAGTISLSTTNTVIDYWRVGIKLPEKLKENLEWTSTLRDVVFFLYSFNNEPLKYVDSDIRDGGTLFTTTPPAYPGLTKKRVNTSTLTSNYSYKFRYVIVRYYKNSEGNWVGYFPMLQKNSVQVSSINDIIVSAVGV